jgi:parallel beta-helix repeat protein
VAAIEGWPGTGSQEDPFIIENLTIVAENCCIDISNTQVYFIIRGCSVTRTNPALSDFAILLSSVFHASIIDCTVISGTGMNLEDCPEAVISGNSITWQLKLAGSDSCEVTYNRDLTLWVTNSDHCVIKSNSPLRTVILDSSTNCTFSDNSLINYEITSGGVGIRIDGNEQEWKHSFSNNTVNGRPIEYLFNLTNVVIDCSSFGLVLLGLGVNVTLYNGIFSDGYAPIFMGHCIDCAVEDSSFKEGGYGVHISDSERCSFTQNNFNGVRYAIRLSDSADSVVENNIMFGPEDSDGEFGISVGGSSHRCQVISNHIRNYGNAIVLESDNCSVVQNKLVDNIVAIYGGSKNCTIQNNYICHNRFGPYLRHAVDFRLWNNTAGWNEYQCLDDDGVNNEWDDGISIGNRWADYNGTGVYQIEGTSDSVDRFPTAHVDVTPPTILLYYSPEEVESNDTVIITAFVDDDNGVENVLLCLQEAANVSMWRNTSNWTATITPKPAGFVFNFRVFAQDWAGNWEVSETVSYTVLSDSETSEPTSTNSPTTIPIGDLIDPLLLSSLLLAGIAAGVVVILLRRKK